MAHNVYIETSIVSYLAARASNDRVAAGHQQATRTWWSEESRNFSLYVSPLVWREASSGDQLAASARLQWLQGIPILPITPAVEELALALLQQAALPPKAASDALHIATAAVLHANFLLTWNCTHIANAIKRPHIEQVCKSLGYEPPILCTPEELTGGRIDVQ